MKEEICGETDLLGNGKKYNDTNTDLENVRNGFQDSYALSEMFQITD